MRRHLQQGRGELVAGLLATVVYLITMDRSASWWDCGEFIATSYLLQVGHPPGAPLYQLLAHVMTMLSCGNAMLVAPLSNALSAIAGGATVGLLYGTIRMLAPGARWGAAVGAACYMLCDTAWFSAVESEVYALAMLFCAADVWLMLRWLRGGNGRLLLVVALMLGMGVCVHFMTLLVLPAMALIMVRGLRGRDRGEVASQAVRLLPVAVLMVGIGLSPYLIVPIRAAANPPINEMGESFGAYLKREQYAKAPVYPRMWRERDSDNWKQWTMGTDGVVGNVVYAVGYQMGYMYCRYLMYNYGGRENMHWRCVVLFVLPMVLGAYGLWRHRRRDRWGYWVVMLMLLFGGPILNIYLNHPCYEPRERDYVYVLSFYAFAIWIGIGAEGLMESRAKRWLKVALMVTAPLTMAVGNWSDHDRHKQHAVHDLAMAHLQSCDNGAVLITLGDNDTFPLWYLQQVEGQRTDVEVYNVGLTGFSRIVEIIDSSLGRRPVYVTQYFYDKYAYLFGGRLRCEGLCWRIVESADEANDRSAMSRHAERMRWHITGGEYIDRVGRGMLKAWEQNTGQSVLPKR